MAQIRKFAFDREFSADGAVVRESTVAPKKLTPEEAEAMCQEAYVRGKNDALAAAEREIAATLKEISTQTQAVLSRLDNESRAMRVEATRAALISARKIADAALDGFGADRAMAAVEAAMDGLRHQPRLIVKVAERDFDTLRQRIEAACASQAYGGAVLVRADAKLRAGAVSVDWGAGLIVSDPDDVIEKIQHIVETALAADAQD